MTCEPVQGPGFTAIVCSRGRSNYSDQDALILEDFAATLRACREAGHKHGTDPKCPRCRTALGLPPEASP